MLCNASLQVWLGQVLLTMRKQGNQKHYQANANAPVFAELRGLVLNKGAGATDGFVVTSGRYTADAFAFAFADGRNLKLVDGPRLSAMVKQAKLSLVVNAQLPIRKPQWHSLKLPLNQLVLSVVPVWSIVLRARAVMPMVNSGIGQNFRLAEVFVNRVNL